MIKKYLLTLKNYNNLYICSEFFGQIIGYCTEYNKLGARIQLHYDLKCDDVQPPCPKVYRSTETFKCMLKKNYKRKHKFNRFKYTTYIRYYNS